MQANFYSLVRKGLGGQIAETDKLGKELQSGNAKNRPTVELTVGLKTTSSAKGEKSNRYESKSVSLSGPGDIVSLNSNSIARVFPESGISAFPRDCFPYVEFWESDFAWRFTPAKADGDRLRPWLTLVVCEPSECSVLKSSWGTDIVTFKVNESEYQNVFPSPKDIYQSAHVQVDDDGVEICRVLGKRNAEMDSYTEYRAFLIPVFETGRLRGIHGPDYDEKNLSDTFAQQSAWEKTLQEQTRVHKDQPLTFPSYYSWTFTTGDFSFAEKVKLLVRNDAPKSGIDVDVTALGEGLDYAVLGEKKGRRNEINMPAALKTVNDPEKTSFPNPNNEESDVFTNLNNLLSDSPVFEENLKIINGEGGSHASNEDDPLITPPIYGGKHVLATSLKKEDNVANPWLRQVNLDLHYRAAAGLGKKAVQRNQEELVNRAWQQIDAVKAMNAELNQKMLGTNVSDSVKYLNYKWVGSTKTEISDKEEESKIVAQMMMNLSSMSKTAFGKNESKEKVSLSSVLRKKGIPEVFVSDSFRRTAEKTLDKTPYPTLMQSIANQQVYMMPSASAKESLTKTQLKKFAEKDIIPYLCKFFVEKTVLGRIFSWDNSKKFLTCKSFSSLIGNVDLSDEKKRWGKCWGDSNTVLKYYKSLRGSSDASEINAINNYVNNKLWQISTVGYTCQTTPPSQPDIKPAKNVFALDSFIFKSLFFLNDNETTVVRIKTNSGWNYYIDRDKMINENYQNVVTFYWRGIDDKYIKLQDLPHPVKEKGVNAFLAEKQKNLTTFEKKKELVAYCVMYTPDQVVAVEKTLADIATSKGYSFDSADNFYKKLIKNYLNSHNDDVAKLYRAWESLNNSVNGICETNEPVMPQYKSCLSDVTILKNGLRDDSNFERLKKCAETYYSEFFKSEELNKKYLEDCLASKYPIKAYPIFPEPAFYYLKDIADEFILPGIDELPDDSISMFKGNPAFIESYLCGMNTEMGRELLWREYPTDQRGSYFKKFWDSFTTVEDIQKDNFFDVESLHRWTGNLGENHVVIGNQSKGDLLFFAIKSDLMKLYPDTKITLRNAICSYTNNSLKFVAGDREILKPVSEGFVRDGIYVVGFLIDFEKALGCPPEGEFENKDCGFMLVFEKAKENIEFKLNENNVNVAGDANASVFACNHLDTTSLVGKHVLTLIGQK